MLPHNMKSLTRKILILFSFFLFQINAYSQTTHIYSAGNKYFSFKIISDTRYSFQIGDTGDNKVKGTYSTQNDTLSVGSLKYDSGAKEKPYFSEYTSYNDTLLPKGRRNQGEQMLTFYIADTLLIPIYFYINKPVEVTVEDSLINNLQELYQFTGERRSYYLYLYKDNSFRYHYISKKDTIELIGAWYKENTSLHLEPKKGEYAKLIWLICSKNTLTLFEDFAIGQKLLQRKKGDVIKYVYLNKVKFKPKSP